MNHTTKQALLFCKRDFILLLLLFYIACTLLACNNQKTKVPDWVVYPEEEWLKITPLQAGFDEAKFNESFPTLKLKERTSAGRFMTTISGVPF